MFGLVFNSFNLFFFFFSLLVVFLLCLLIIVAYFTFLERKIMASIQRRRGPDFVGFFGIVQPLADAFKLICKEVIFPKVSYLFIFILTPFFIFFLSLFNLIFIPFGFWGSFWDSGLNFLFFLIISSLSVYSLFLSGYASNSKYAVLGSIRSIVQMLSYEISFIFLFLPLFFVCGSLNISSVVLFQFLFDFSFFFLFLPNSFLIFICILAETNRAPFDLPEAEAELVAGYNVEYSSIPFAYFFLGEYLNMFLMCIVFVLFFFKGFYLPYFFFYFCSCCSVSSFLFLSYLFFFFKVFFFMIVLVWVRATLPRMRYDLLMTFCWKFNLVFSLSFFCFFISLYICLIFLYFF